MKTFIVATLAGYTEDEHGREVANLQILENGIKFKNADEARAYAFEIWKNNFPSVDEYRVYEVKS